MLSRPLASIAALTAFVLAIALCTASAARAGTLDRDTTWAHAGLAASPADGSARWGAVAMLPDGRFLAAGRTPGGQAAVARFTAAGELDPTWAGDQPSPGCSWSAPRSASSPRPWSCCATARVLLGATTVAVDSTPSLLVARLSADGHLDPSFATGGKLVTTSGPETELGGLAGDRGRPHPARGHLLGQRDRPRAAGAPDRRRRPRRGLRDRRRGRLPARRQRHDLQRPGAGWRRAASTSRAASSPGPGISWSSRG